MRQRSIRGGAGWSKQAVFQKGEHVEQSKRIHRIYVQNGVSPRERRINSRR